jgi:hypothetical protein
VLRRFIVATLVYKGKNGVSTGQKAGTSTVGFNQPHASYRIEKAAFSWE